MIQVVVLAGGKGTRLREITGNRPKPLALADGRTLLERQFEQFAQAGIRDVLVLTGYGADQIADYCGDGSAWGVRVNCVEEPTSLGTAGAVLHARDFLNSEFIVTYGDTVFDLDFKRMIEAHQSGGALATLLLHPNDHPHDSDLVEINEENQITAFHPYPHPPEAWLPNLVNAGLYVLKRELLEQLDSLPEKPDFGKHIFPLMLRKKLSLKGYCSPEYIKDAGTPDRLAKVSRDIASGRTSRLSLRVPTAAIFLDRDGTINQERGRIVKPDELDLIPGAAAAISKINSSDYRAVVVTNQAVIARGDCTEQELKVIHNRMETLLGNEKAFVDRIYYCPHIPDRGFLGERLEFKIHCECRKPNTGMLHQAARDLNLDLARSWLIGDSTSDMEAARRAGLASILVNTGLKGRDEKWPCLPLVECTDLLDAVDFILERWPQMVGYFSSIAHTIHPGDLVLIGGQARSGKSQHAAALRYALSQSGKQAVVVPLDCWLYSAHERLGPSVLDRYDLGRVREFLNNAAYGGVFKLPRYDRQTKLSIEGGVEISIKENSIIILEGVPALIDRKIRDIASHTIAIRRNEKSRQFSFMSDYKGRGLSEEEIDHLLTQRLGEEFPLVEASLAYAQVSLIVD